jgi:hypothetical protein
MSKLIEAYRAEARLAKERSAPPPPVKVRTFRESEWKGNLRYSDHSPITAKEFEYAIILSTQVKSSGDRYHYAIRAGRSVEIIEALIDAPAADEGAQS